MPRPKGADAVRELRGALEQASHLLRTLEGNLNTEEPKEKGAAEKVTDLEERLKAADADREELMTQLVEAEHQAGKLMNLYVATYQLHATLDPSEVQATIAEIAVDLLGAERFVLLLKDEISGGCEIALARGVEEDTSGLYEGEHYQGGDTAVDGALEDGLLRLGPTAESDALAVVPLRVQEAIVGGLVILKLLDHRQTPLSDDRDLLDLLAAHAASALFAARVYSATDRKLRTLESLVKLIRGT